MGKRHTPEPVDGAAASPVRRGRPRKQSESIDTREMIMDSAEELFSHHGFHGVTVREVARECGVDPALLNYYFSSKRGLFDAVFSRRAKILNDERLAALNLYEQEAGEELTAEGCLEAFLRPVLLWSETGGPGWKNYFRLVAAVNNTPAWGGETMTHFFDPVIQRLISLMRRALPEADDRDLYWCYQFVSGALALSFAETGRIDKLSAGLCRSGDMASIRARMAPFMAAGFLEVTRRFAEAQGKGQ